MSLSPKITIYPGTDRQQNVGIMGRAVLELQVDNVTVAKFNNLQVRKTTAGKWWIQYPAEEDRTGKKDDNGYPVKYPYYVLFPGQDGKARRDKVHDLVIQECQRQLQGSGMTTSAPPVQNTAPVIQTAPPVQEAVSSPASDDALSWDLD